MNSTLNNLALLSFKRKARKAKKEIEVINFMNETSSFDPYFMVREGETLILWSEENGFHSIVSKGNMGLVCLAQFPDKYNYDEIYHFGILNKDKTKLYVYRCYDQLTHQNEVLAYGLQFQIGEFFENEARKFQQEMEHAFLETGNMSWL